MIRPSRIGDVRRSGKSSLLKLYREALLSDGVAPESVLSLNFESLELAGIDSAESLNDAVAAHPFLAGRRYIFLDEVQLVPAWQRAVNSLRLDATVRDQYIDAVLNTIVTQGLGVTDIGFLLENVVYFELRRRYQKVSIGKYGAEEIDFVCFSPTDGLAYYQVTASMLDAATAARELRPLQGLRDSYPKTILTLDQVLVPDITGIRQVNLLDWLSQAECA